MPGIVGMGTTFNLPNYVGELFGASPEDTPLLSSIGGLTGGKEATNTEFSWQGWDLRDASDSRQRLEGAAAPEGESRVRYSNSNVLEIHQESVEISYTALAAKGISTNGAPTVNIGSIQVPADEMDWLGWTSSSRGWIWMISTR